jgi:hypothetical protein
MREKGRARGGDRGIVFIGEGQGYFGSPPWLWASPIFNNGVPLWIFFLFLMMIGTIGPS